MSDVRPTLQARYRVHYITAGIWLCLDREGGQGQLWRAAVYLSFALIWGLIVYSWRR